MIRPILIALALSSLTACSLFEDPVSRQMSYNGETQWMAREQLRQKALQPGQPIAKATAQLEKWGFEEDDRIIGTFSDRQTEALTGAELIYFKYDNNIACRLRRHVIIVPDGDIIKDAFGTTGEAGCL